MINALKYTRTLEAVGFSREQAETHVQMITDVVEVNLVTKQDLRNEIQNVRNDMLQMEQRLTIKMGTMLTLTITVLTALIKLF